MQNLRKDTTNSADIQFSFNTFLKTKGLGHGIEQKERKY